MPKIKHIESNTIITVNEDPRFVGGVWECGDQRFVDPTGDLYIPVTDAPKITKTHFLLTFTSAERVKARELRATDPILDDFWLILDGTDTVNLSLPSVQSGIEYTLQAVKAGGLTSLNVSMRKSEILSAILQ